MRATSAAPFRRTILSNTSRARSRRGRPIMPDRCASMRSIAKCVLPVLVGPRTAVTRPRKGAGLGLRKACRERRSAIDSTCLAKLSGFCPCHASGCEGAENATQKGSRCDLWTKIGQQHGARTKRARITNRIQHHFSFTHYILSTPLQSRQFLGGKRSIEPEKRLPTGKFAPHER